MSAKLIKKFVNRRSLENLEKIPTGSLVLDFLLEGGIPRGKIIELWGGESTGKTTLCLNIANEFAKRDFSVLFIDLEDSITAEYLEKLNIAETVDFWKTPTTMDVITTILGLNKKEEPLVGQYHLIIIDSVAALRPDNENFGGMAKLLSFFLSNFLELNRKLPPDKKTTLLLTNQLRANVSAPFGGQTEAGGYALKHYVHLRIRTDKIKTDKANQKVTINFTVAKSKTCIPYTSATVVFDYAQSRFVKGDELYTLADLFEMLEKENGVIKFKPEYGLGMPEYKREGNVISWLDENADKVEPIIRQKMEEFFKNGGLASV